MKNIKYKITSVCLMITALMGCKNDILYKSLPETVPLDMTINDNTFIMGEVLKVCIKVNSEEGAVANEDFDIYFTAKEGTQEIDGLFEKFNSIVTFPKGESQIQVDFPIKSNGLTGNKSIVLNAMSRGYKISNSSQSIKISDYHRVTVSLDGVEQNSIMENKTFVLLAKIDKPTSEDITIKIKPKENEADYYENLPEELVISRGRTEVRSFEITMKHDGEKTGDKDLVLSFESCSKNNPMNNSSINIHRVDIESLSDPELIDMKKVYPNPEQLFISDKSDSWFNNRDVLQINKEKQMHPNSSLNQWIFEYAIEFHNIERCKKEGSNKPRGLSDANDITKPNFEVDNNNTSKISEKGKLILWAAKKNNNNKYPASAYQCSKVMQKGFGAYDPNHTLIYPGMRIEFKVSLGGDRTGFIPTIDIKDHSSGGGSSTGSDKSITVLGNISGNKIKQSVTGSNSNDSKISETILPTISDDNIYWVEMEDDKTIKVGINGKTTLVVSESDLKPWPFAKESMSPFNGGYKGLLIVVRMAPSQELLQEKLPNGWDSNLNKIQNYEKEGPRMEVDWIRFYKNSNYKRDESIEKINRNTLFY